MADESTRTWLVRALIQGVFFALVVSVVGALFSAKLTEAIAPPTCSDTKDLASVRPKAEWASSSHPPESDSRGRQLTYGPGRVLDGDTATGWAEGVEGLGHGESLTFQFEQPVSITLLCIVNGYGQSWTLYTKNPRVRALEITASRDVVGVPPTTSANPSQTIAGVTAPATTGPSVTKLSTLSDAGTRDHVAVFQSVPVDLYGVRSLTLRIKSVYSGTTVERIADTSLSEIEFWGPP